jgi:amino acid adenylation domain-containing protein
LSSTSLSSLFLAQCAMQGDKPAYVFLRDDLSASESIDFSRLGREVHDLAGRLGAVVPAGGRVLLAFPPGLDFVRAFWACLQAGCVAVPVPAPDPVRLLHGVPRLRAIIEDTGAALVLTSGDLLAAARRVLEPALWAMAPWTALADLAAAAPDGAPAAAPAATATPTGDALAYLQYTSGSTMAPRGVRITHAQAIANMHALNEVGGVGPDSRSLVWLPHFHDYGLVHGVLAPMAGGLTSWLMSPLTFLRRPLRWLDALASLRITHSGAPASAYVACLRALDGRPLERDLSALVSLNCGAEPIRADTVAEVLAVFGAAGMRPEAFMPAYGLAEAVLGVSASPRDRPATTLALDARALARDRVVPVAADAADATDADGGSDANGVRVLAGCGRPLRDTELLIVDPVTLRSAAADAVGEIWVGAPGVGDGYWRQSGPSDATFGARLADAPADGRAFLRTGDLGFMHGGELFVTGRLKDLVIVHGGNHYPQDLEWTAEHAHAALRPGYGAAFSVDGPDGEALVLLLETERRVGAAVDADAIAAAVRRAVGEVHGLAVSVVALVRSGSLPRSSSGKVQRRLCRQRWLDGELDVQAIAPLAGADAPAGATTADAARALVVMPRDATEQVLWEIWRDVFGRAAFGVHESFFELGGTSLLMTQVASRIGQRFGVELPLAELFDHTSIAALARHVTLAAEAQADGAPQATAPAAIARVARGAPLPVSLSQRRMWVIQQFDPASSAYNVAVTLRLRGTLDADRLQRAFDLVAARHEGLRTRFALGADEPVQLIDPPSAAPIRVQRLDLRTHAAPIAHARELLSARLAEPFDLAHAPLHRAMLLRLDERDHVLSWVMHHAITDNWSFSVLMHELFTAYTAWEAGREPAFEPMPVEYADYAAWQRSPEATAQRRPQMDYWLERLRGLAPLDLPTDFARPQRAGFQGGRVAATLPPRLRDAMRAFCARTASTPFVVLLSVFKLMLSRAARTTDVAVGTPVANRHRFAAEHLVGTLVNTLVMRTDLSGDPSFTGLVERVRATALAAYAHQEAPFDELVEALGHDRATHPEGLVRVLFNVLNAPLRRLAYTGLDVEEFEIDRATAQFDLAVHVDTEFTHQVHVEYATDLYAPETAARLLENYLGLLERLLAAPERPLSETAIVAPAQLARLRDGWNATAVPLPAETTVHRWLPLADPARRDAVAVSDATGRALTYAELDARSNALARVLRGRGIGRGQRVGLGVARDAVMVVALLGVLKSGAAYVPLDPGFPAERLRHMAGDAGLAALLVRGVPPDWLADAGVPVLTLGDDGRPVEASSATGPVGPGDIEIDTAALSPDVALDARALDAAYMIYTSGSTGRPKGVAVPHRAVVNFLASMAREPGLAAGDRLVAVTTLSFDIAVLELLLPLAVGAHVVLASAAQVHDPHAMCALLARHDATAMQATPTLWRTLADAGWGGRRTGFKALIGGEPLPLALAERLLAAEGVELWNMYGPTETTVWSTLWRVTAPRAGIVIGRPIDNTSVQVLDAAGHPCPIGVPGELCIGGAGVTLGYHRQPVLTAERFPPDPESRDATARLYRTGDLGRWRHDGRLEHLGRLDRQVKLRGLRIELGEIESALLDHPDIADGVVVTRAQGEGGGDAGDDRDVRLVAYVVTRDAHAAGIDAAGLRQHLRARLPEYMLPQHVVRLDALPLLPNGKIDRNALPAPQPARAASAVPSDAAAASGAVASAARAPGRGVPTQPAEVAIAAIWRQLLDVEEVDLRDNFFDLGGHSLLAMRAVVAIREAIGRDVDPPRLVFETLEQIAREPG